VADELGGPVDAVGEVLQFLQRPDPESRSLEEDGRRIVHVGSGHFLFKVVNHEKYVKRGQDRTAYWREWKRKKREEEAQKAAERDKNADSTPVHSGKSGQSTLSTHVGVGVGVGVGVLKKQKKGETKPSFTPDCPPMSIATMLYEQLNTESLISKMPSLQEWATHVDRMLRIDKIPEQDIRAVVDWLPKDPARGTWPGWGRVIRSTQNLRRKWEDLWSQFCHTRTAQVSKPKIPFKKCYQCKEPADLVTGDYDTPYCRKCRPQIFAAKYPQEV